MERRPAGALRVVLVRDRRAEERHDAVARVLVHRPLEAVHAVGEDHEEAVEDPVPRLGVELLGELHGALYVGEEDGYPLALAFEGRAGGEDLLGEVPGGIGAGREGTRSHAHGVDASGAAAVAEARVAAVLPAGRRADHEPGSVPPAVMLRVIASRSGASPTRRRVDTKASMWLG